MNIIPALRKGTLAVGIGGVIHDILYAWLMRLATVVGLATVRPGGIIHYYVTDAQIAAYCDNTGLGLKGKPFYGLAIANGNNGTPDLIDRYVIGASGSAGGTLGSHSSAHTHSIDHDHGAVTSGAESGHTHAIDHDHGAVTSGAESGHTHDINHDHASVTSGAGSAHSHGATALRADISIENNEIYQRRISSDGFTATRDFTATGAAGAADSTVTTTSTGLHGTTDSESSHTHAVDLPALGTTASGASSGHTHSVDVAALTGSSGASTGHTHSVDVAALTGTSGAASATDNRPASTKLIPFMQLEVRV